MSEYIEKKIGSTVIRTPVALIPTELPKVPVTNIKLLDSSNLDEDGNPAEVTPTGDIYWIASDTKIVVEADTGLSSTQLMVMVSKVKNGDPEDVTEDKRFVASIDSDGKMSMSMKFKDSGNYVITEKRLNEGLSRLDWAALGVPEFRLDIESKVIDLDVYEQVT